MVEQRLRAIETGEYMEKVGLAEILGLPPPIGHNFIRGESTQDVKVRAAQAGIYLPGTTSPALAEATRLKQLEHETGVQAYAMPGTKRWSDSLARGGSQAGWDIPSLISRDFSDLNLAGATTVPGLVFSLMPATNAAKLGSPDAYGAAIAADTASRKTATGQAIYCTLLSAWVYALIAAGTGIYVAAAGTTMQPFVASGVAAASIKTALAAAAFNLNTNPAIWSQITLVAPADRAVAIGAPTDPQAGLVNLFYGDSLLAQLVTTGAVNVLGNTLAAVFELA
jgi:hypothetical protein